MSTIQPELNPSAGVPSQRLGLSLQQKSWVITIGVLLALAALLAVGIERVFGRASDRLEQQWLAESVRRVETIQAAEIDELERTARDYATWTETYEVLADAKAEAVYAERNLLPASFANLQLDAFLLFDTQGSLRMGRIYQAGHVLAEGSSELANLLRPHAVTVASPDARPIKGIIRAADGVALFAILPVHRDDGSGMAQGALAQLRFLKPERVKRVRDAVNLDLSLVGSSVVDGPSSEGQAQAYRSRAISDDLLLVHLPLKDVEGGTVGWWELKLNRDIHQQGMQGRLIFYLGMSVLILAAAVLMGWMLRILVISRLEALHSAVAHVGATSDLSLRLPLKGADELTQVGHGINHMLEALERGEVARVTAEHERERLNKQLQEAQKLEAIGTLTGGLAHDFNNLLTSIHGSTALLQLECPPNFTGGEHLRRIEEATSQAARLVRQMMAFGRRSPTVFLKVSLLSAVGDAIQLLRPSVAKGIEVRLVNEAGSDLVQADAAQLQQVVVNLATNALHAMACGEGQLTFKISDNELPDPTRLETSSVPAGDYLRLTISDNGCGIAPAVLPRIFEPFFTTKPVGTGSGLGLAVVHGIIAQHHGTIGVQSEPGRGSTFFIHLPKVAHRASANGTPSVVVVESRTSADGNILLVDDDALVRETLEAGLRHRKYRVTCATGAAQALKLVRERRGVFDAVITDQMMPGMTGIELGEILAHENPGLPLILVTGFASALDEAKVKALGFSAMLMKPVTVDVLDDALRIAQHRERGKPLKGHEQICATKS